MELITKYLQECLHLVPDDYVNDYYYGDSTIEVLHDNVWICIQKIYGNYEVLICPTGKPAIKMSLKTEEEVIDLFIETNIEKVIS